MAVVRRIIRKLERYECLSICQIHFLHFHKFKSTLVLNKLKISTVFSMFNSLHFIFTLWLPKLFKFFCFLWELKRIPTSLFSIFSSSTNSSTFITLVFIEFLIYHNSSWVKQIQSIAIIKTKMIFLLSFRVFFSTVTICRTTLCAFVWTSQPIIFR
jgi:hypothetical protein